MNFRTKLVDKLDMIAPALMTWLRFTYYVKMRQTQVYPTILDGLFIAMQASKLTAVDVGSNRGVFTLYLAGHFRHCVSIEPVQSIAYQLSRAVPRNVEVINAAAGAASSFLELRIPISPKGVPMHALASASKDNDFLAFEHNSLKTITVKQITLDSILCLASIGFVKIDVEGFEGAVLAGANELIMTHRPVFFIEIFQMYNKQFREVFTLFDRQRYNSYRLGSSGLHRMSKDDLDEMELQTFDSESLQDFDYLFIPVEKLNWVKQFVQ